MGFLDLTKRVKQRIKATLTETRKHMFSVPKCSPVLPKGNLVSSDFHAMSFFF